MDTSTRTDGMAVLCEEIRGKWSVLGMTEVIKDNLNPSWIENFNVKYRFEEQQNFKVAIFHVKDAAAKENIGK